ncbi:hypothetical protein FB550_101764 [Neobacillus bataviensis]|uniref:Uncharacterized protein n=1 Tax=Neobacillus bataviensis TaxID=220685 RepID=A0A561DZH1_9BACI|nr:hypothetical protein FB550_101764 [Neobacillus bataviensis]
MEKTGYKFITPLIDRVQVKQINNLMLTVYQ